MTEAMAAEIEKLIERLEKATGPDRELDALITIAANARPGWAKAAPEKLVMRAPGFVSLGVDGAGWEVPLLTKSIDTALTLVPEGGGCVGVWKIIKGSSGCVGEIDLGRWKGWHETSPVIALCIASLKAIAALRALSHKGKIQ